MCEGEPGYDEIGSRVDERIDRDRLRHVPQNLQSRIGLGKRCEGKVEIISSIRSM